MSEKRKDKYNRLKNENSIYLKEHMDNPIDWYPWSEKAFKKSQEEGKLIFLSIGYASCLWCHRMNEEVFSNKELGEILNEKFIPIIVDKEERKDIDKVYGLFALELMGRIDWPLNLILTPDMIPIYSENYIRVEDDEFNVGLLNILKNITENWEKRKEDVIKQSKINLLKIEKRYNTNRKGSIYKNILLNARNDLEKQYDWEHGGYFKSPKQIYPQYSLFMFKDYTDNGYSNSKKIAEDNLEQMYRDSIFDHVGGGFFKNSEDETWNNPRLEKNLMDNGGLLMIYTFGYLTTKNKLYKKIVGKIYEFLERELKSDKGGYYTAINGEYRGEREKYYYINGLHIENILGKENGKIYNNIFNMDLEKLSLPNLINTDLKDLEKHPIDKWNKEILNFRKNNGVEKIDKKILLSLNGILAGQLAYAGSVFNNNEYIERAETILKFLKGNMLSKDGEIFPIYLDGKKYGNINLTDYSYFLFGLINAFISTDKKEYLDTIRCVLDRVVKDFWSEEDGTFLLNKVEDKELVINLKDNVDRDRPSSVGLLSHNLIRIYQITGESRYFTLYRKLINSYGDNIKENPSDYIYTIISMQYM